MAFCPKCGADVLESDNFCRACGANLQQDLSKSTDQSETKDYGRYGPSAFPTHVLTDGEVPLFETRPLLWIRVLGPIVFLVSVLAVLVVSFVYIGSKEILYAFGAVLLIGLPWVLLKWLQWKHIVYAATNRRILCQTGIISKSYVDCPLGKVQTIYLEVPVFGRINDFGTVRVATAGEARVEIEWKNVKEPMKTHRILNEIIEKYGRGPA